MKHNKTKNIQLTEGFQKKALPKDTNWEEVFKEIEENKKKNLKYALANFLKNECIDDESEQTILLRDKDGNIIYHDENSPLAGRPVKKTITISRFDYKTFINAINIITREYRPDVLPYGSHLELKIADKEETGNVNVVYIIRYPDEEILVKTTKISDKEIEMLKLNTSWMYSFIEKIVLYFLTANYSKGLLLDSDEQVKLAQDLFNNPKKFTKNFLFSMNEGFKSKVDKLTPKDLIPQGSDIFFYNLVDLVLKTYSKGFKSNHNSSWDDVYLDSDHFDDVEHLYKEFMKTVPVNLKLELLERGYENILCNGDSLLGHIAVILANHINDNNLKNQLLDLKTYPTEHFRYQQNK